MVSGAEEDKWWAALSSADSPLFMSLCRAGHCLGAGGREEGPFWDKGDLYTLPHPYLPSLIVTASSPFQSSFLSIFCVCISQSHCISVLCVIWSHIIGAVPIAWCKEEIVKGVLRQNTNCPPSPPSLHVPSWLTDHPHPWPSGSSFSWSKNSSKVVSLLKTS